VMNPVLLSVKATFNGASPDVGCAAKAATGTFIGFTTIRFDFVVVLFPAAFLTVRLTVYFPTFV